MTQVQVDWLTVGLAPVIVVSLGLSLYAARRKVARAPGGVRLPTWGRVSQSIGIISALFVGFIQIVWGG